MTFLHSYQSRNSIRHNCLAVIFITCFIACTNGDLDIGENFVDTSTYTALIDSVSIHLSTIKDDSVSTSKPQNALVGQYKHPLLGSQECRSYFPLNPPTNYDWEDNEKLDSVSLILFPDTYFWGDSLENITLRVHAITQGASSENETYYNNSALDVTEGDVLGELTFKPKPRSKKPIEIKLNTKYSNALIDFIKEQQNNDEQNSLFVNLFKGIRLSCDTSVSKAIMSISTNDSLPYIRIFSHVVGLEKTNKQRDVTLEQSSKCFNQIINHDKNNPFNQIKHSKNKLSELESNGLSLLQSGSGFKIRIDFPYLNKLLELKQLGHIVKAELLLKPDQQLLGWKNLPEKIYISELNKNNTFQSYLVDSNDNAINARLILDQQYHENTYYIFDISEYINTRLSYNMVNTDYGLCLSLPHEELGSSLNSLVIKGKKSNISTSKLNLYYYYYDKN